MGGFGPIGNCPSFHSENCLSETGLPGQLGGASSGGPTTLQQTAGVGGPEAGGHGGGGGGGGGGAAGEAQAPAPRGAEGEVRRFVLELWGQSSWVWGAGGCNLELKREWPSYFIRRALLWRSLLLGR